MHLFEQGVLWSFHSFEPYLKTEVLHRVTPSRVRQVDLA
jgi:hypothetical protein